ncbi:MAG: trehalase family glycosidase, partial [Caldilineaceae bacterium]
MSTAPLSPEFGAGQEPAKLSQPDGQSPLEPVLAYIDGYWEHLVRRQPSDAQTLIGLPYPYVVPGVGAMFQEMYYWDSFFTALGLVGTPHDGLVIDM